MKRFIALARVSSREQEREGFSLEVQEDALRKHAEKNGGKIEKLCRIAETASKHQERRTFKEVLAYARKHASRLDGVLFYKVDRAARNIFDYVELERLEADYNLPVVYVAQPTENTPAGRMMRRTLANMASFYTEQQSLDVREGMARRVEDGLFPGRAPFGYRNVRVNGRSLVKIDPENADKIRRIFELYAWHSHTLDSLQKTLQDEGVVYTTQRPVFSRSKIYEILCDRSYIGEVRYRKDWHPGSHKSIIDPKTFERVHVLLGNRSYERHESVYGAGLITCGHCGRPIIGEVKRKMTKGGMREYVYYRCAQYNRKGHPRVRMRDHILDTQVLELFKSIRIEDDKVRHWVASVIREKSKEGRQARSRRQGTLQKRLADIRARRDRLIDLRLAGEFDAKTFKRKNAEFEKDEARIILELEAGGRQQREDADLAIKTFELSQSLIAKWDRAETPEKRRLLETVCLNFSLDGANLTPTIRKPFDILAKGLLVRNGRGGET